MSLTAIHGGHTILATPDGPREAKCRDCGDAMRPRCGEVITWHWAHLADPDRVCVPGGERETEWHREWKATCADPDRIEVAQDNRRADVMTPYGWAVEFQHSSLDVGEVRSRERDWRRRMVWVFDCLDVFDAARLEVKRFEDEDAPLGRRSWNLYWRWAKDHVLAASRVPVFLHIRPDELIYLGRWRDKQKPLYGYGWKISRDEFVDMVVNGVHPPRYPKRGEPLDPTVLWSQPLAQGDIGTPAQADERWEEAQRREAARRAAAQRREAARYKEAQERLARETHERAQRQAAEAQRRQHERLAELERINAAAAARRAEDEARLERERVTAQWQAAVLRRADERAYQEDLDMHAYAVALVRHQLGGLILETTDHDPAHLSQLND